MIGRNRLTNENHCLFCISCVINRLDNIESSVVQTETQMYASNKALAQTVSLQV
jgi:hypothetical protein